MPQMGYERSQRRRNDAKAGTADIRVRAQLCWRILENVCKTSAVEPRLILFFLCWMILRRMLSLAFSKADLPTKYNAVLHIEKGIQLWRAWEYLLGSFGGEKHKKQNLNDQCCPARSLDRPSHNDVKRRMPEVTRNFSRSAKLANQSNFAQHQLSFPRLTLWEKSILLAGAAACPAHVPSSTRSFIIFPNHIRKLTRGDIATERNNQPFERQ